MASQCSHSVHWERGRAISRAVSKQRERTCHHCHKCWGGYTGAKKIELHFHGNTLQVQHHISEKLPHLCAYADYQHAGSRWEACLWHLDFPHVLFLFLLWMGLFIVLLFILFTFSDFMFFKSFYFLWALKIWLFKGWNCSEKKKNQ